MSLAKSACVGLLLVFGAAIVGPFVVFLFAYSFGFWKWDSVAFMKTPSAWLIVLAIFVAGFVWEWRRQ
jgi:hypothetical protein